MNERAGRTFRWHAVTTALILLLAAGTFFGFLQLGGVLFHGTTTTVRAMVPTSSTLAGGARVTMAGASVGRVTGVERRGIGTLVEMAITDDRVLPLPADSRVALRQRTPIGENYVDIAPGRSTHALGDGDVLPIAQSDEYVDVDQVLSTLTGSAREDVRRLVQATGGAIAGRWQTS